MRFFILFLFLLAAPNLQAQKYYSSYITELGFGEEVRTGEYFIVFEELIADSRCPKGVNCIRSGEAKVLVSIYRGEEFIRETILVFTAEGTVSEKNNLMFSSDEIRLMGMALHPYPVGPNRINDSEYWMEIKVN